MMAIAENAKDALSASIKKATASGSFTYDPPTLTGQVLKISAKGKEADTTLKDKYIFGCINLDSGDPEVSKKLVDSNTPDVTCL